MAMTAHAQTGKALEISGLHKSFGDITVLEDISVSMEIGEFLVLVGPSGCGKSTLLNCIAGLEEATGGSIRIAGNDVTQTPPRDRDIAMVFQSYALYPTMSVAQNIGFGMKIRRIPKPQITQRVSDVASLLQIDHLLDRRPNQLSGGQRQRVAMGRALVREPALFLFDEPLSNLDAKLRTEMRAEIKRLHQTTGTSFVYVTHDQIEAMTLATKIVVLKGGSIQQTGSPEDIYDRPANCFVADFMGSPPMNLIRAKVAEDRSNLVFDGTQTIAAPRLPDTVQAGSDIIVGVRPEGFVRLAESESALTIVPKMIENAGADAFVSFDLGGTNATARFAGRFREQPGAPMKVAIDLSTACYFDPVSEALIS